MIRLFFLILLLLMLSACEKKYKHVTIDINSTSEIPSSLKSRYQEYWENFSDAKYDKTYKLELPYLQFIKSLDWYLGFRAINKSNFSIKAVNFKQIDKNIIHIRSKFISDDNRYSFDDRWINVNDKWYHYYYPSILPPDIKEYRKRFR